MYAAGFIRGNRSFFWCQYSAANFLLKNVKYPQNASRNLALNSVKVYTKINMIWDRRGVERLVKCFKILLMGHW